MCLAGQFSQSSNVMPIGMDLKQHKNMGHKNQKLRQNEEVQSALHEAHYLYLLCLYRQNNIDIVTDLVETEGMQPNMCFLHRSACLRQPAIILHKQTYDEYKPVV